MPRYVVHLWAPVDVRVAARSAREAVKLAKEATGTRPLMVSSEDDAQAFYLDDGTPWRVDSKARPQLANDQDPRETACEVANPGAERSA